MFTESIPSSSVISLITVHGRSFSYSKKTSRLIDFRHFDPRHFHNSRNLELRMILQNGDIEL